MQISAAIFRTAASKSIIRRLAASTGIEDGTVSCRSYSLDTVSQTTLSHGISRLFLIISKNVSGTYESR